MYKVKAKHIMIMATFFVFLSGFIYINSIGWYGYKKCEYRRSIEGNRKESIERIVFQKDLRFTSTIDLENFDVYIEKGFKYGFFSSKDTRFLSNSEYPFQISFVNHYGKNNLSYYIVNEKKLDSTDNITIFLKRPILTDTLFIGVDKFSNQWDSIGYIKVWDASKEGR